MKKAFSYLSKKKKRRLLPDKLAQEFVYLLFYCYKTSRLSKVGLKGKSSAVCLIKSIWKVSKLHKAPVLFELLTTLWMDRWKRRAAGVVWLVEWKLLYFFFPCENVSKENIVAHSIEADHNQSERSPTTLKSAPLNLMEKIHFSVHLKNRILEKFRIVYIKPNFLFVRRCLKWEDTCFDVVLNVK